MPDQESINPGTQQDLGLSPIGVERDAALPPVSPPKTNAPFQFNQQVNIQQIPPRVWEKLSPEQIVDLSKTILRQVDEMDSRHFTFAMESSKKSAQVARIGIFVGGLIAVVGLCVGTYLCLHENAVVGGIIVTFLATTISHVVGSRISQD